MLTNIKIRNFKTLKKVDLQLTNLNLLMGLNGMGKSSLLQTLILLRQSYEHGALRNGSIVLNGRYLDLGKGKDIFYQYAEDDSIGIELTSENENKIDFNFKYTQEFDYLPSVEENKKYEGLHTQLNLFNTSFFYLNAERIGPKYHYPTSAGEVINLKQMGKDGQYAAHFLSVYGNTKIEYENLLLGKSTIPNSLIRQVGAWLSYITPGTRLNVRELPEFILLDYQFQTQDDYTNPYKPPHVGFGLNYVLPVIVALLSAQKGHLVLIENPESHVHPRGQSKLGELLSLVAQNGVQLIVETHSDHIINGMRVAVKENQDTIDNRFIKILYFDRELNSKEHKAKVTQISIDRMGELNEYPNGLMDEWGHSLRKLIR